MALHSLALLSSLVPRLRLTQLLIRLLCRGGRCLLRMDGGAQGEGELAGARVVLHLLKALQGRFLCRLECQCGLLLRGRSI